MGLLVTNCFSSSISFLNITLYIITLSHLETCMKHTHLCNHSSFSKSITFIFYFFLNNIWFFFLLFKMNFLASVGGDDYKQLTTAILKQLMAKEVCLLYSLYGRKQKKSFSALTSCKVVIGNLYNYLSSYSFNLQN